MNSMQLKDKLKNISKKENLDFNVLLRNYMYERFMEKPIKDDVIIKGCEELIAKIDMEIKKN